MTMTNTNDTFTVLERIASTHLGIDTLQVRNGDALDFHDVSVWGVHQALQAAFELGAASMCGEV